MSDTEKEKPVCWCEECGDDILPEDIRSGYTPGLDDDWTEYVCFNCGNRGEVK